MGSGGIGRGPGPEGEVCLPRAVLFGTLALSEVRAYAALAEAGVGGLTAPDLAAVMGLKDVSNARKLLAALAAGGFALEGADRKRPPKGSKAADRSPTGRGCLKRFVAARALDGTSDAADPAGDPEERAPRRAAESPEGGSEARTACERRGDEGRSRTPAGSAVKDVRPQPEAEGPAPGEAAPSTSRPRSPRKTYDPLTERCLQILGAVANFPANRANNARKIHEFRCSFRFADPIKTCEEYVRYHKNKPADYTRDHHARLNKFFEVRDEDAARERGAHPLPPATDAADQGPAAEGQAVEYVPLPPSDAPAEAAKDRLIDAISEADGRRRDRYFQGFVAPDLFPDGTLVLVCEKEDYASFIRGKWGPILEARRAVVASSAEYAEGSHLKADRRPTGVEPAPAAVRRAAG